MTAPATQAEKRAQGSVVHGADSPFLTPVVAPAAAGGLLSFQRGDQVYAHDVVTGTWRPCWLSEHAPYYHLGDCVSDGWRILWTDIGPDAAPELSRGGWVPVRDIREEGPR